MLHFLITGSKLESLELGDCQSENKAIRHKRPCITGMLAQVNGVIGALNTLYGPVLHCHMNILGLLISYIFFYALHV